MNQDAGKAERTGGAWRTRGLTLLLVAVAAPFWVLSGLAHRPEQLQPSAMPEYAQLRFGRPTARERNQLVWQGAETSWWQRLESKAAAFLGS